MAYVVEVIKNTLMITSFVFVTMLVIEYVNVLSRGAWQNAVSRWRFGQYILAALVASSPGCLGAFAVGSLYIHRIISFGALCAGMIAGCGDEAFVMLAMFPAKALLIFGALFLIGSAAGLVIDYILRGRMKVAHRFIESYLPVHEHEERCECFNLRGIINHWKRCTPHRGVLAFLLALLIFEVIWGHIETLEWNWERVTFLAGGIIGLFVVSTVPDHFLEEHLWNHIVKVHIWRIFLWTFGALIAVHFIMAHFDLSSASGGAAWAGKNHLTLLLAACLVGIIPESGPHLIFVTMYANGMLPLSILLASCIVQDGHGMLPILAHSRRVFVAVKTVNFVVGFIIGLAGYLMGW